MRYAILEIFPEIHEDEPVILTPIDNQTAQHKGPAEHDLSSS